MEVANTVACCDATTIMVVKSFIVQSPGAYSIKNYGLVIYSFRNKLVCLPKLLYFQLTMEDTSFLLNLQFFRNLQSVKFSSTGCNVIKLFTSVILRIFVIS